MTQLAVSELVNTLTQEFTYTKQSRCIVDSIRPYLYIHNNPSGTFYFDIIQSGTTIATSSFTSSTLYSALSTTDLYAHLFYKLTFDKDFILNKGTYTIKMRHTGYSYLDSSFIGWVHMHDDPINDYTYNAVVDNQLPLTFEIYEKRFMP